ncbi:uncharacterized protein LOC131626954 [Vicia villosa]|uniref:uncharacterized protein LOC131626954 n=1 Tax=Vicia villosa TaxID=3911 RepID=UPI00273CE872|nr:uncharacterized protein LOC131626954 [Vicia villosa]
MKLFNDFHSKGTLVKAITSSFLALIPKKKNPQDLFEYRPICLVGSIYKILAKILAARMRGVLDKLVLPNQTAFVPDRSMMDGVLMVNEILDWAKRKKKGCLILKVDFKKAYKSISWIYLRWIIGRMGLGKRWLKWMESCIFTSHMSMLVNGSATKEFKVQRGLRQGDLISPFLFVIAMEGSFPFKFLGIWVGEGASKRRVWKDVVANIMSSLSLWKGRKISIGGRATLIGPVLNVIPIFTLSFFKAPSKTIQEIRGLLSNFLWNGNVNKRSIHWVKWENVCKPREKGGLGIRDVGDMNRSLLLKWKWRILKEDNAIWSRFLLLRYQNPKFKVLASSGEVLNLNDSSWWKDIILNDFREEDSVEGFNDWVKCDFKKDNTILFWHSCWLGDQTLRKSFMFLFDLSTNKLYKVSEAISWNNSIFS